MKEQIEEAELVKDETAVAILSTEFTQLAFPKILDREASIAMIKEVRDEYSGIVIADTKDKANYDKVVLGIRTLRDSRLPWKKAVDQVIANPAKAWVKGIADDIKAIEDYFKEGEAELKDKKEAIDEKKKEEKAAEDNRKAQLLVGRIQKLVEFGGKSDEIHYLFEYDLTLHVKIATLKDMEEDKWQVLLHSIKTAYDLEQERLKQVQIDSQNQLQQVNDLAASLATKQKAIRIKELNFSGFKPSMVVLGGYEHVSAFPGRVITPADIDQLAEDLWDHMMLEFANYVAPVQAAAPTGFVTQAVPAANGFQQFTQGLDTDDEMGYLPTQPQSFEQVKPEPVVKEIPGASEAADQGMDIVLHFDSKTPYIEFELGGGLVQRIFPVEATGYAKVGLEPDSYYVGSVKDNLKFIVFQK